MCTVSSLGTHQYSPDHVIEKLYRHMRHKTLKIELPVLTLQAPGPLARQNIQLTTDKHQCFWRAVHLW